jgi:class 3 adenylate cyclase
VPLGRPPAHGDGRIGHGRSSDLEGFTTYSERFAPNEMADMLGEYYNRVTEHLHPSGTLKEYVGDELMAIFGTPMEQPTMRPRRARRPSPCATSGSSWRRNGRTRAGRS